MHIERKATHIERKATHIERKATHSKGKPRISREDTPIFFYHRAIFYLSCKDQDQGEVQLKL
ncbi:hypothetical protein N782_09080 [Pontibacillus yanchengensis Y32]|uniref:Uncharacterized protein n=1 Tax=Pontibacillus yanchengensis Y32 TaxID=1385514 RepID=A0A0A2TYB8_9BACI|nr:hypothetical protein N782_09080 [Pontibacillus yanchengensis Y32]